MAGGKHLLGKPKGKHIFGTAKVGEKGQIVIPKEARTLFGVQPGDTLALRVDPWNIQVFDAQTERNLCRPVRKEDAQ